MKKATILITAAILLFVSNVGAQENEIPELRESNFQFTFMFPPFSTNGVQNSKTVNRFSLNLFVGNAGGVDGVELGSFINSVNYYVDGFQVAGFGNVVGGSVIGTQLAGFINVSGGDTKGFQGAGFMNVAGGDTKGLQGAGFGNVAGGSTQGVQLGGFFNVAGGYTRGAQLAGFVSVAGEGLVNAQVSGFCNVAKEINGAQLSGFANVAGNVKGIQMAGFINVCDSIDGVPIGFISVVKKNGYRHFDFSISETQYINFSYRMGVRHFYNIYSIGKPSGPGNRWFYGFGLGTETDIRDNISMNLEAIVHQELWIGDSRTRGLFHIDRLNLLNQFRVLFAYQANDHLSLYFGPTLNVAVADINPDIGDFGWQEIGPNWAFYERTMSNTGRTNVKAWFGITGGIRL
ncbi:hypothetical protein ACFLTU_04780 [Bacteroidota bacterium]